MLELWELGGRRDCRFSTFSWRTRLALHHKGLAFVLHPVAVSDKAAIAFSGQGKVPILKHDDHVVTDSWAIGACSRARAPRRPQPVRRPGRQIAHPFLQSGLTGSSFRRSCPYLMRDVLDCVEEADARHLRSQIEAFFKKSLEQLAGERGKALEQVRRRLQPVRKALEQRRFLGGDAPAYADHILFGVLQWARVVSTATLLEADDAVAAWFERVLDLYDGVGRKELPRAVRMQEAAA